MLAHRSYNLLNLSAIAMPVSPVLKHYLVHGKSPEHGCHTLVHAGLM
jgi:hypothetical protein